MKLEGGVQHDGRFPQCHNSSRNLVTMAILNDFSNKKVRIIERSLRYTMKNTRSLGFSYGQYGGMKSSSTPPRIRKSSNAREIVKCQVVQ
jgi:hypothetical protein